MNPITRAIATALAEAAVKGASKVALAALAGQLAKTAPAKPRRKARKPRKSAW